MKQRRDGLGRLIRRDPFEAARRLGRDAAHRREDESANPYEDHRKPDGRLTFSRAWVKSWLEGYREVRAKLEAKGLWSTSI